MISSAGGLLLEAALRALAAAAVVWSAMRLLRVENVLAQKAAWGVVLAVALAMPVLMRAPLLPRWAAVRIPAPLWHKTAKAAPAPTATQTAAPPVTVPSRAAMPADDAEDDIESFSTPAVSEWRYDAEPRSTVATPATHASAPAAPGRLDLLAIYGWLAYLCVSAALLLRLLIGLVSSIRLWMQAQPVDAAAGSGLRATLAVRASRRIASPVNIGSGIVLPADYTSWDAEKLRVVLAHESSHVRQRDFYLQLLAGLYAAVTWFSPLGWWLRRRLCELGEAISDRAGMEAAASPSAYAQLLLEFAALPRAAITGVAMAHASNLSERVERLLNDSSFRRAFSGGRRALLMLVPAVLFAAAALVRVQAAQVAAQPAVALQAAAPAQPQTAAQAPDSSSGSAASQSSLSGQSHPAESQVTDEAPAPPSTPQAAPAPQPAPAPSEDAAEPMPLVPPVSPAPSVDVVVPMPPMPAIHVEVPAPLIADEYHYAYDSSFGDAYAIVGDPGTKVRYAGDWDGNREAEIAKARAQAHGHFLLFRHDDETYFIDDPAIVAQVEAMQKPIEDLDSQMRALDKQMRDESLQDRVAAREAERKIRDAQMNIPAPDLTKEMADLNAAVATLKDKSAATNGTVTREQLAEIQRRIAELQQRLMRAELKVDVRFDSDAIKKISEVYSRYGAQMGKLGQQIGELSRENNRKIRSIIDQSLKNGKAKPVQ